MTEIFAAGMLGVLIGICIEWCRKRADLRMDADNGVTFLDGKPHVFRPYDERENYPHREAEYYEDGGKISG